jgi:O-succinylbenzoate synthase
MAFSNPSLDELLERMTVVSIPLRTPFRGLHHREVALFEGPQGPGEWAAFTEYDNQEAAWWLLAALEQAFGEKTSVAPTPVPVNAIVPALPPEDIEAWLQMFPGVTAVKVKIAQKGEALADDIARVREVRRVCGDQVLLRLDVNASWDVDTAKDSIEELEPFSTDYVEQPVATIEEMTELKTRLEGRVRLAADELIRSTRRVDFLDRRACDVAIIKPSPLGGFSRSIDLASQAVEREMDVVVSSALETSVGLTQATAMASWVNQETGIETPHGLSTQLLLTRDVTTEPLTPHNGWVMPAAIQLNPEALEKVLAPHERVEWWRARLERSLPLAQEIVSRGPSTSEGP